jgi:hypothetical protein
MAVERMLTYQYLYKKIHTSGKEKKNSKEKK